MANMWLQKCTTQQIRMKMTQKRNSVKQCKTSKINKQIPLMRFIPNFATYKTHYRALTNHSLIIIPEKI